MLSPLSSPTTTTATTVSRSPEKKSPLRALLGKLSTSPPKAQRKLIFSTSAPSLTGKVETVRSEVLPLKKESTYAREKREAFEISLPTPSSWEPQKLWFHDRFCLVLYPGTLHIFDLSLKRYHKALSVLSEKESFLMDYDLIPSLSASHFFLHESTLFRLIENKGVYELMRWNVDTGETLSNIAIGSFSQLPKVAFHSDLIFLTEKNRRPFIFHLREDKEIPAETYYRRSSLYGLRDLAISNGTWVWLFDNRLTILNLETGEEIEKKIPFESWKNGNYFGEENFLIAGNKMILHFNSTLFAWDLKTGDFLWERKYRFPIAHLEVMPGEILIAGSVEKTYQIDLREGKETLRSSHPHETFLFATKESISEQKDHIFYCAARGSLKAFEFKNP